MQTAPCRLHSRPDDGTPSLLIRRCIALLCVIVCGCAIEPPGPAPAAPVHQPPATSQTPRIVGSRGELSPERTRRLVDRLQDAADTDLLARHLHAVEHLVHAPLRTHNAATLLVDGPQTHAAMYRAIEASRDHVNLESYIIEDDIVGGHFAELLIRKRRQGVRVNLIYDSVGSLNTPKEYFDRLREAGVAVCEFNPVNPLKSWRRWRLNNRDHRKLLVVDGRIGFTGGINISRVYASSSLRRRNVPPVQGGWRDTDVEVQGPVVADMQSLFVQHWFLECGDLQKADYFPDLAPAGKQIMRVIAGDPGDSEIYAALLSAIERAERSIYLTVGYFVPDPATVKALERAARRGVDVRIALPGVSDFWAPLYAARSHYGALLRAGIRLYERRDALLHAKTAVVDGVWSTVGSTNVDWRSFVHNAEANVVVLGVDFGTQMQRLFQEDLDRSDEIDLARWRQRGTVERVKEWVARQWEYLL